MLGNWLAGIVCVGEGSYRTGTDSIHVSFKLLLAALAIILADYNSGTSLMPPKDTHLSPSPDMRLIASDVVKMSRGQVKVVVSGRNCAEAKTLSAQEFIVGPCSPRQSAYVLYSVQYSVRML